MSTTTTASFSFTCDNTVGTSAFKIRYRLSGTSVWTQKTVSPSGTTVSLPGLSINTLYDFQVVNINGSDNPASAVSQSINITDPEPEFYPTNIQIGVEFANLSEDIDTYTITIARLSTPGTIIETAVVTPADPTTYTLTGLTAATQYVITITPAANQFTKTFSYFVTTEALATCPAPNNVTATLA
jgi:hypothetical protein